MDMLLILLIAFDIPIVGIVCIAWSIHRLARRRFISAAIVGLIGIATTGAVTAVWLGDVGFIAVYLFLMGLIVYGIPAAGIACIAGSIRCLLRKRFVSAAILGLIGGAMAGVVIAKSPAVIRSFTHRDLTEYSLDEDSFDTEAMAKIEQESGIDLPDGARGLRFHHKPPIDPIVSAKIEIPADAQDMIAKQMEALTDAEFGGLVLVGDVCEWWPPAPENVVLSKHAYNGRFYVELYLVKEKDRIILYIKYFTV